jgi:hypothetical protein
MSIDPEFEAASQAAEGWPACVSTISKLAKAGNVDEVYKLLMPATGGLTNNLYDDYWKHCDALHRMKDQLAAVSDGPVKWEHGRGWSAVANVPAAVYPHVWSSAHEAAAGIAWLAIKILVRPLQEITDPGEQWTMAERLLRERWKALAISLGEDAALQERIRRERAKLLAQQHTTQQEPATVWYHGGLSYSTNGANPVLVSHEQHNALKGFLERNEALDTRKLEGNGVSNVSKVMKKLAEQFPGAVRQPSAKGEGYYVRVRSVR